VYSKEYCLGFVANSYLQVIQSLKHQFFLSIIGGFMVGIWVVPK